ncbi:MAG: helix-turn-helix transcriptional regulator [Bacteroidetes bacterium]|nr:helix-turn-helix transcriptional regulator [Bacteroidota bacterium]
MPLLTRTEEIILTAVIILKGNAYGITIRDYIKKITGEEWSFAKIYDPLNKLTQKEYVRKIEGEPTPERGGRRKILYEITKDGILGLKEIQEVNKNIQIDLEDTAFGEI